MLTPGQVGAAAFAIPTVGGSYTQARFRPTKQNAGAPNSSCGWLYDVANRDCYRGDAAGRGGFTIAIDASWEVLQAAHRAAIGLYGGAGTDPTLGAEPSTRLNAFYYAFDSTDALTFFLMHNDGAGACTKVATGIVAAALTFYRVLVSCSGSGALLAASLYEITNAGPVLRHSATPAADIPAVATLLGPGQTSNSAAAATLSTLALHGWVRALA